MSHNPGGSIDLLPKICKRELFFEREELIIELHLELIMQSPFILAFLFTVLCILSQSGEAFWRDGREIEREKRTFPMRSHFLTKKHTPRTFANDEQFYSKALRKKPRQTGQKAINDKSPDLS